MERLDKWVSRSAAPLEQFIGYNSRLLDHCPPAFYQPGQELEPASLTFGNQLLQLGPLNHVAVAELLGDGVRLENTETLQDLEATRLQCPVRDAFPSDLIHYIDICTWTSG